MRPAQKVQIRNETVIFVLFFTMENERRIIERQKQIDDFSFN